jgi:hypothetical protein
MSSLWKRFDNEWFHTRSAVALFATSATVVAVLVAISELFPYAFANAENYSTPKEVTITVAMMLFALSNLIIVVGMFRFWVAFDRSRPIMRRIWFVIMIVGLLRLGLGAAFYCFAVYVPQVTKGLTERPEPSSS